MTTSFTIKSVKSKPSLGATLRKERESRGWTTHKTAEVTCIQEKFIRAIEDEKFDKLPEGQCRLNIIKKYIKTLGNSKELIVMAIGLLKSQIDYETRTVHPPTRVKTVVTPYHLKLTGLVAIFLAIAAYLGFEIYSLIKPPALTIIEPSESQITSTSSIMVRGSTDKSATIIINDKPVFKDTAGNFEANIDLSRGANTITVRASKRYSRPNTIFRTVFFNSQNSFDSSKIHNANLN